MYQDLKAIIEEHRIGKNFRQIFEEIMRSNSLLHLYGGPFNVLRKSGYQIKPHTSEDEGCVDMTSDLWMNLGIQKQIEYGMSYQQWYAEQLGVKVVQKIRCKEVEFELRLIPPGKFLMGSPAEEKGRKANEVQKEVLIKEAFWCGVYPVTQEQWTAIIGHNDSYFKGERKPVESVSLGRCLRFCRKTKLELLTEKEWEYACRAGTTTAYSFGEKVLELKNYGWYRGNSDSDSHPVGERKPNSFGLYDMHGNTSEWCATLYHRDVVKGQKIDEKKIIPSSYYIVRGGNAYNPPRYCRSASRQREFPTATSFTTGFRIGKKIEKAFL